MARTLKAALSTAAFVAAALCSVGVLLASFSTAISEPALRGLAYGSGAVSALLLLSMLFDPASHYAIQAANRDMQGGRPSGLRFISPFDAEWGLLGAKTGSWLLMALRSFLFVEFLCAMPTAAMSALPLVLSWLGFATTVLLTLDQLKQHYPRRSHD